MKLYFATGNEGKVNHTQNILPEVDVEQLDIETVEPSVDSIEEIARAKVEQALESSDIEGDAFLIADDSGLFVDALNGFPGPQTHFFDRKVGKEGLLKLLEDKSKDAEFRAAIGLYLPEENEIKVFTGRAKGKIVEPRGEEGFGYDPMFLPEGSDQTWAEDSGYKDDNSHREEALDKLQRFLSQQKI